METRRRGRSGRSGESAAIEEDSNWNTKGKGVALEEAGGVTVMVPDDNEDEVEMLDSDEENC